MRDVTLKLVVLKGLMDRCWGIDVVYHQGKAREVYYIWGKNEIEGIMSTCLICAKLDALKPDEDGGLK